MHMGQSDGGELIRSRRRRQRHLPSLAQACLETLECRQLLTGYGEYFNVSNTDFGHAIVAVPLGTAVAWSDSNPSGDKLHLRIFDKAWNAVGADQAINTSDNPVMSVDLASAADGHMAAVWREGTSILAQQFNPDGTAAGASFAVGETTFGAPHIAMAPDGQFAIAYTAYAPLASEFRLYAQWYSADGHPLSDTAHIVTAGMYDPGTPSIAMGPSGETVIAWNPYTNASGYRSVGRLFDPAGNALSDEIELSANQAGLGFSVDVAMDASGDWAAAWVQTMPPAGNPSIALRRFDASGNALDSANIMVVPAASVNISDPRLAMAADGRMTVLWNMNSTMYLRRYSASATPIDSISRLGLSSDINWGGMDAMDSSGDVAVCFGNTGIGLRAIRFGPGLAPTDISLSRNYVAGQMADELVGTLSTIDPDTGDTFTYSLPSGVGDNAAFALVGDQLRTATPLNPAARQDYSVTVESRDSSGWPVQHTFSVRALKLALLSNSVQENQPAGTLVSDLAVLGTNGQTVTFALDNTTDPLANALFSITGDELRTAAPFDFESVDTHQVRVRANVDAYSFSAVLTITVTDANDAPTSVVLSNHFVQASRPAGWVVGSLSGTDPDAGDTLTYSLVSGDGATDNAYFRIVGTELQIATVLSYPHAPVSVRIAASDAGGLSYESAFVLEVVEKHEAPTAVFHAVAAGAIGQVGHVRFSTIHDEPQDIAAGLTYSYDLDGDGVYEIIDSTDPEAVIPAPDQAGVMTLRGRIADRRGQAREYQSHWIVNAPMDWYPLCPSLTYTGTSYADELTFDTTSQYEADTNGLVIVTDEHHDSTQVETREHMTLQGTTWYTTQVEFSSNTGISEPPLQPLTQVPTWDEGIAQGTVLSWSGVQVTAPDESGVQYDGPMVMQGTFAKSKTGKVSLEDGSRFEQAMLVKTVMTATARGTYLDDPMQMTLTATDQTWYVKGIGPVKSDTTLRASIRIRGKTFHATDHSWNLLGSVPDWSQFVTLSDGTLYVQGTDQADNIRASVTDDWLVITRNGVPNRVPVASVHQIIVSTGDGNDRVDLKRIALPTTIEGGAGNDTIYGGSMSDTIDGEDGVDWVYGNNGDDALFGGAGDDRLYGGNGNDSLTGGAGLDLLQGQAGNDWIDAHDGLTTEKISGGAGTDTVYVDTGEKSASTETRTEGAAALFLHAHDPLEALASGSSVL